MEIRAFQINESVYEENLKQIDKQNINKVFLKVFSPENTEHLKIDCRADENSILKQYKDNSDAFQMVTFADELRKAELKNDGTRNKQITEGNLFIKRESKQLLLLKLENIEVIDKEKNYEMKTSFSTESNYYKGCILGDDLNKIIIIDKNRFVAKYWREGFLKLSLNRDEYQNSKDLIQLLKEDNLFTNILRTQDNFQEIKDQTENYIFDKKSFDKVDLAGILREQKLIEEKDLNKIYSDESRKIDTEFSISKKAIREEYNKTIYISQETKIYTTNYDKLIKRQGIEYQDGKIILPVDEDFITELPKELKNGY
ncbi:hypothetical protein [Vagococcus lutrae]|uniref:hypothetical protein n=1 Tax=Vagococcus lutrae TaxID=81947 RepID=UPI000F873A2C|nr:hypothetical protein [Vagococcus lutrae]RST92269.1 hypothetical protein CBF33_04745 [Vagococcus lutrae]